MNPSATSSASVDSEPAPGEPAEPDRRALSVTPSEKSIYGRVFWLAYAANVSLVMANSLTFRFAEFVSWLGGSEKTAGTIVSVGIFAALFLRLVLGQAIDNYGTRRLWAIGCFSYIAGTSLFLVLSDLSWPIYVARLGFAAGIATMFTCSMVHIQNLVPANRRTEIIGNLGSSGFVGMVLGSQLGDWIFRGTPEGHLRFLVLFGGTVVLGLVYLALVLTLTRGDVHKPAMRTPAVHRLVFRYWPGNVVVVAMMMGISVTVTTVFLTRFATKLGLINGVGTFFTAYAVTAFLFRVQTATWSRTIGRHQMIWLGLTGHCLGFGGLPFVTQEWHFLLPAVACGFGHALLIPGGGFAGSRGVSARISRIGDGDHVGLHRVGNRFVRSAVGMDHRSRRRGRIHADVLGIERHGPRHRVDLRPDQSPNRRRNRSSQPASRTPARRSRAPARIGLPLGAVLANAARRIPRRDRPRLKSPPGLSLISLETGKAAGVFHYETYPQRITRGN